MDMGFLLNARISLFDIITVAVNAQSLTFSVSKKKKKLKRMYDKSEKS
jgi:hypothetical protein